MTQPQTHPTDYLSFWKGQIPIPAPLRWPTTRPSMEQIAEEIAAKYRLTLTDLKGPSQLRRHAWPRQHAMWALYQEKVAHGRQRFSLPRIGRFLGGRDHGTILFGIRRHEKRFGDALASGRVD